MAADDLQPGQEAVVGQLTSRSPDQLRHLEAIGLVPGARIILQEKDAGSGPGGMAVSGHPAEGGCGNTGSPPS